MNPIQELQAQLEQALGTLEVPASPAELYDPIKYTLSNGGKRMRPLLVLIGCKIFNDDVSEAINPALGVEMFHNFTLLHDDIMDDAPLRRGKPSVHKKWDSNIAILSGDAMMVKTYQSFIETRSEVLRPMLRVFNRTAVEVCEGQQFDMNFELRDDVSIAEYLDMIRLKTAVLLAASLQIGGMIGGASKEQSELLYDFGLNAGIAFQLQDDILDVYGESAKVGKQKGGDIICNKKTFLLLKAQELATGSLAKELAEQLGNSSEQEKVAAVTQIYDELKIRQLAEARMWEFYNKGMASLEKVEGNKNWIEILRQFSHNLMHRES
ncbi:MAG: geranylgeranyl diphosphate synthase type II [Bacteroidia bacterium]|jgi:geranylgeranyl diphosphate synthase type II